MTTDQILYLDLTKEGNDTKLQSFLCKIPQYKKYKNSGKNVPLELLEKMYVVVSGKYAVRMQWISNNHSDREDLHYWSVTLVSDKTHNMITSITAFGLYELMAKTAIALYALTKGYKGGLITREELALEKANNE